METPGSIFALSKAVKNEKFSKAIADKYENAGTAPYAGVSLVFLNLKQNQILRTNTEETIQIICQLMLQWNNRQNFPLAKTTVFSHIRENIEHDLQTLSCENKALYRELNFIWQGIRMLDRKESSVVDKKRAQRRQDYLQRERRKWDEKIQKNLTQIRQNAVQVPAELRPADVRKAIFHQIRLEQNLRIRQEQNLRIRQEQNLRIRQEQNLVFIKRDSFRELYRMLEHRLSDKTVLENRISGMELPLSGKTMKQPLPNETQRKARQKQIPAEAQEASAGIRETPTGVSETPAGIQTVDRIVNRLIHQQISRQVNQQIDRQINQQIDRQINQQIDRQLQTEASVHRSTAILGEGITEAKLLEKTAPGTGARGTKLFEIENETRLRNLSEIFTGFIYRDSFRELYRMLEHRLPDKTALEHLLPGETLKMIPKTQIPTGVQEAPAGIGDIFAGTQIENHIVNRQINQQISRQIDQQINRQIDQQIGQQISRQIDQQINRQINRQSMQIKELPHGITEIREAELSETEILRTKTPMTGIIGIDTLKKDAETRLRSLGELFTGFIYHGSFRELHRKHEHRMPDKMIFEHRLTGETQKTSRQNQVSGEVQETPAEIQKISAGIQTVNRQMSQKVKQQINQQVKQQINQRVKQQINQRVNQQVNRQLMQTEALTRRVEDNLFRQISVRDDVHLLKTISERQRTNGNISTVMTQTNGQRQFDIRQRDILTYNEAESLKGMLKHADPALTGHPVPAAAQTLKTQAAESVQPLKYLAKEQRAGKLSEQDVFLNPIRTELQYLIKKEAAGAEALQEQKQNVKVLMEKINIQEQVIEQIKNARQGQNSTFGKAEVKMVADTVLERLYKDIHLQRLRMGMS